ncbi:MAG: T9SS type A sorting domain-containing protein, partial [FCB group bacterium]
PGDTSQSINATQNGKYSVQATQDSCHSLMSDVFDFVLTGVYDVTFNNPIFIYPNPAESRLSIVSNSVVPLGTIEIFNILGTKVFSREESNKWAEVDISTLQSGIYLIKIGDYRKIIVKN